MDAILTALEGHREKLLVGTWVRGMPSRSGEVCLMRSLDGFVPEDAELYVLRAIFSLGYDVRDDLGTDRLFLCTLINDTQLTSAGQAIAIYDAAIAFRKKALARERPA